MARTIYDVTRRTERPLNRDLVACDPGQLRTLSVPIQRGQGILRFGSFIDADGNRATIAPQVEGILAATVNSDFPDPDDSLSGQIAILHYWTLSLAGGAGGESIFRF